MRIKRRGGAYTELYHVYGALMPALLTLLTMCILGGCAEPDVSALRSGDIIFHTSLSQQSAAIQSATRSKYSHVGIIYRRGGELYVLEAVKTVRFTPFQDWVRRGKNGNYAVKRLKDAHGLLDSTTVASLVSVGSSYIGKRYDMHFHWSNERMYCSELVWKVFQEAAAIELCPTGKLRDFDIETPVVRAQLIKRYGNAIPLDETVVAPSDIFNSDILETVH